MKLTLTDNNADECLSTRNLAKGECRLDVDSETPFSSQDVWKDLILHQSFFDEDDCLKTKRWKPRLLLEEISAFDVEQLKNVAADDKRSILPSRDLKQDFDHSKNICTSDLDDSKINDVNRDLAELQDLPFFDFNTKINSDVDFFLSLPELDTNIENSSFDFEQSKKPEGKSYEYEEKKALEQNFKSQNEASFSEDQLKLVPYVEIPINKQITSKISNVKLNFSLKNIDELTIDLPQIISQTFGNVQKTANLIPEKDETTISDKQQNFANEDLYDPEKFDQMPGPWPVDLPLPMPCWGRETDAKLDFSSVIEYEAFASRVEMTEQRLLEETNYDTVDNFLQFSQEYRKMRYVSKLYT